LLHGFSADQPFTVGGSGVDTNNFRVTTSAGGLDFPQGLAALSEGSLLVTISPAENYSSSSGKLVRFTDTNLDGIANGPGTVLYSGLPGALTMVPAAGSLVLAWDRGALQQADDATGSWTAVADVFSPYRLDPGGPRKFFRVGY